MLKIENVLPCGTILNGKYNVEKVLGMGGFGITYKVYAYLDNVRVSLAMKEFFMSDICDRNNTQIAYSKASNATFQAGKNSFIAEAMRLRNEKVKHPNIVGINEVWEENGTAYFVMEFISGPNLHQWIRDSRKGQPLSAKQMLAIMTPVIEAVDLLHAHRIVHLDIKPDNIVLSNDDNSARPVLIDFGLAKHYDSSGHVTSTIQYIGASAGYAPIEQVAGNINEFSPETDIYALAATCFFLLTGHAPNNSADYISQPDLVRQQLGETAPKHIIDAIAHAMTVNRTERTHTVAQFARELGIGSKLKAEAQPLYPQSHNKQSKSSKAWIYALIFIALCCTVIVASLIHKPNKKVTYNTPNTPNTPEWVDLGLSVKWATTNIGASAPTDIGQYFAWGETTTKGEYVENTNPTSDKTLAELKKAGFVDANGLLSPNHDAATALWGNGWRMPTYDETIELTKKCKWEWQGNGYKITGPSGQSIYLPAGGLQIGTTPQYINNYGYYWTSTPNNDNMRTYSLNFGPKGNAPSKLKGRYIGRTVRPVHQ